MRKRTRVIKTAIVVLALGVSTAVGGSAGAAGAKWTSNGELTERTQNALQAQDVLQDVAYQAYAYDGKIGEAVKGKYLIKPEKIIPWRVTDNSSISVVRVRTTKGKKEKLYTYAFIFSANGLKTLLLFPGGSNTDPSLFSDVFAPASAYAQAALKSEEVTIKDTKVVGQITPSGWDEEWLWVNNKGKTYTMKIAFSTDSAGQGTVWNIKGSRK